ncbi:MAG: zinc ribbon domain-containing protein [Eubacteriales bacterium]|nr:zinc ribbon domain-containing protein [Eubacteriales bacterium]
MPLYLFSCKSCGHKFEALTSFSKIGQVVCEKCGEQVERLYDGATVFGGSSEKEAQSAPACPGCCPGCARAQR